MTDHQLSTKQVAEQLGIRVASVTALIRSGQLRAADVSLHPGGRPCWKIDPQEIESFLRRRTHSIAPPRKRRRNSQPAKKYF